MNNKSEHGKIFKKLRLERGLKLKEVAGDIISTQTLRRFEADETSVSIAVLEKLLENLGVDYIDYILELKSSVKDRGSVILTEAYQLLREGNPSAVLTLALAMTVIVATCVALRPSLSVTLYVTE